MSATDMVNVEVTITLSYPIPAKAEDRYDIYGASNIEECVQIDFDNDPVAMLLESTVIDMQVSVGRQA